MDLTAGERPAMTLDQARALYLNTLAAIALKVADHPAQTVGQGANQDGLLLNLLIRMGNLIERWREDIASDKEEADEG